MLSISSRPQCVKGYIFWFFPVIMLLINQLSCMKIHGDFIWKDNCLIFKEKKIFKILAKVKPHHHSIDKIYFHYYTLYYILKAMGINVFNQLLLDILCFSSTKLFQKFPQYGHTPASKGWSHNMPLCHHILTHFQWLMCSVLLWSYELKKPLIQWQCNFWMKSALSLDKGLSRHHIAFVM